MAGLALCANRQARFQTRISYDTLANTELTGGGDGSNGAGSTGAGTDQLTTGVRFTASYAFSGKTSFNALLDYYSQSRDNSGISSGSGDGSRNTTVALLLGATWLPSRNWQVNCNLTLNDRNERRDSGSSISLTPYTAYGGSCSAQFVFQ